MLNLRVEEALFPPDFVARNFAVRTYYSKLTLLKFLAPRQTKKLLSLTLRFSIDTALDITFNIDLDGSPSLVGRLWTRVRGKKESALQIEAFKDGFCF